MNKLKLKASELRLNNFIQNGVNKTVEVVAGIEKTNIVMTNFSAGGPDYYWEGIPLTEEWLERFGFEKIQDGFFERFELKYWNNIKTIEHTFSISLENFTDYNMAIWLEGNTNVHIYTVHRLQNLYFALTGKELELKKS